jgi:hypothetical protein
MIEFKPRIFVLPAIALAVVAMLHGAADGGRSTPKSGATCGSPIRPSMQAWRRSTSASLWPPRRDARSLATTSPDLGQISDNKQEGQSDAFHGDCQGEQ